MRFKKRLTGLFIKAFSITIIAVVLVFGAGWLTLQGMNKPPVIEPERRVLAAEPDNTRNSEPAYTTPEHHPDDEKIGDEPEDEILKVPPDRKPLFYTFLMFGTDGGVNTDTIMVGAYDGSAQKAYIIAIPRDTRVNVQRKTKKINAAYPAGTLNGGGHDGGVNQLLREIRTLVGFVPDYYVSVNFNAFTQVVDALGGLSINVPYNMQYDDIHQDLSIHFSEGTHTLDGHEVLEFARHRQNNELRDGKWVITKTFTDYERIANQQQVIRAVADKVLQASSITKIPEFVGIFDKYVKSDVRANEVVWFTDQLRMMSEKDGALETYTLPISGTSGSPEWYELPDEEAILELVNDTVNPYIEDIKAEDLDVRY